MDLGQKKNCTAHTGSLLIQNASLHPWSSLSNIKFVFIYLWLILNAHLLLSTTFRYNNLILDSVTIGSAINYTRIIIFVCCVSLQLFYQGREVFHYKLAIVVFKGIEWTSVLKRSVFWKKAKLQKKNQIERRKCERLRERERKRECEREFKCNRPKHLTIMFPAEVYYLSQDKHIP